MQADADTAEEAEGGFLDDLEWADTDCTIDEFEAEENYDDGRKTGDNNQQQQDVENSNEKSGHHGVLDVKDADVIVEIENQSTENDVDVLINKNERLVCVCAGTGRRFQLPHNIRYFCLKNCKSGYTTRSLPFEDNYRHLRVEDCRHGSIDLELFSVAGSFYILRF